MNKRQLATKIWDAANKMRSKIEANEYKDYILGFIFYKYLSDREERYLLKEGYPRNEWSELVCEEDEDTVKDLTDNIGYFIPFKSLFSTWIGSGNDFDVSQVRDALSSFTRHISPTHKGVFEGVFDTLQTGLSKLGDSAASQTKSISKLIHLIEEIPMDGRQDYDVLGFIYEYLISQFAANAGKKAGEFYTPHEVSFLMSELVAHHLRDRESISIYDPTSGSGSLLINIGRSMSRYIAASKISYYAQELKANTYNLTRMNLVMRGINPSNIETKNADTLEDDWPLDAEHACTPLRVDSVVSNPPYSQNWDPVNKEADPRYAEFGLAPKSKADYAFLLHDLYHLKNDGIMCIVLPHGVLFRGGEEGEIRKRLLEKNHIHAIIGLPANIFFGTGIPTIVMVLRRQRTERDVLIVDASKGFIKSGKSNKLRACDIRKITDAVTGRQNIRKFSRRVSMEEIRQNEYNLNIPRYVDSSEPAESWDIYASMFGGIPPTELECLQEYWAALPALKDCLFHRAENAYSSVAVSDIRKAIQEHASVKAFKQHFASAFESLPSLFRSQLVEQAESLEIARVADALSADVLSRAEKLPLVDKYAAFQLFSDAWGPVATDLEIIQTEGLSKAARLVDENKVIKKKDGKEVEVQDGWVGHIMPFDLVQQYLLPEPLRARKATEERLEFIASELSSLIEDLEEEEKRDILNDNQDAFNAKAVAARVKDLKKNATTAEERSWLLHATTADKLLKEEKALKSQLKKDADALISLTKLTIETLSDEQISSLLEKKWIAPLAASLASVPEDIISTLASRVQALADKYATTFTDLESEISSTEKELAALLDNLTGSDTDMAGIRELRKLLTSL